MRKNKSQRDQRRAHLHATTPRLTVDTETGSTHLRHRVDVKTGMYRGRQVLETQDSTDVVVNDHTNSKTTGKEKVAKEAK